MRFGQIVFVLCILALPVFAQPPSPGSMMMQFGGKGGREGMMQFMNNANPDDLFNQFSRGKDVIRREDLDPFAQMMFDRAARQLNITNGQISRDQFKDAFGQMRSRIQAGGGANAFGGPDAESQDRFAEQRFRSYDKNSDGLLSSDEMPEALRNERDKWDTNKDGFIDLTEFKGYFKSRFEQRGERPDGATGAAAAGTTTSTLPAQDQSFDISRPIVYRAGHLPKELPDWFGQLDIDGDGQVGLYEWVKGSRTVTDFRNIDVNDDGFVTAEEVIKVVLGKKVPNNNGVVSESSMTSPFGGMPSLSTISMIGSAMNGRGANRNAGAAPANGNGNRWWGMGGERGKGGERSKVGRRFNNNAERPKGGERGKDTSGTGAQ